MNAINIEHLTKFYGKARGIADVSLSVAEGDFFGFIGPNGAGKSTTIRTLLGLIYKTGGKAEILGMDAEKNKTEILRRVGYMPSEAVFYPELRVGEVLKLSQKLRKTDCSLESKRLCERFDLDVSKRIRELSLGNRKKVAIVSAMQHCPELYIMDEPTSGLDPLMQREFFTLLEERNKEGATVFLSSHILSEIQRYCKTAAVIKDGKILSCDSVANLAHTDAKRITVSGINDAGEICGAYDIKQNDETVSFLYSGDCRALLLKLSEMPITDISIADPDLEEIFMHCYSSEEAQI